MTKELKNKEISIGWDVGGWSGKNHGLCVLEYDNSEITLLKATKLNVFQIKNEIENILNLYQNSHEIILGIDAPLQFPILFKEIINQNPCNIFHSVQSELKENPIAWRITDLYIKNNFGKTPLSASFSFLTSNATVAITVLGELKAKFADFSILPFDAESRIRAIEVYPGLLKSTKLKSHPIFTVYQKILEMNSFKQIKGFDYYFQDAKEKSDIADAVICALYGLGFSGKNQEIPTIKNDIPKKVLLKAKEEGWIYHPDIL
ncbi:Protein of unknown function [Marivirga sericea]|uniref:DUF429 domain-containing protein n=1 Tax=Marivirga sericea TaxID=1028 RepID=A0A1X7JY79_9BACT|nr:DUF429 domain-containing protein [Marivirga sericea]SMG33356.1 Protein of unknown function [Marivirga sericea]